jgi:hypothetical protein
MLNQFSSAAIGKFVTSVLVLSLAALAVLVFKSFSRRTHK